jgi:hypothetical protein
MTDDADRWVSVTERLPGEENWRPTYGCNGEWMNGVLVTDGTRVWCMHVPRGWFDPQGVKGWGITAWRRLPEPWKEEK